MMKKSGPGGYRAQVRKIVEERAAPPGMRLPPILELLGSHGLSVQRHTGILEYSDERVLVLAGPLLYEIEGEGMVITSMSRDSLSLRGRITGVRLIGEARP